MILYNNNKRIRQSVLVKDRKDTDILKQEQTTRGSEYSISQDTTHILHTRAQYGFTLYFIQYIQICIYVWKKLMIRLRLLCFYVFFLFVFILMKIKN